MSGCIFCQLIANEIPSYTVYEDDNTRAFLDIYGATDGHVLVVYKRHEEKLTGYKREEITALFSTVQKIAQAVEKAFDTTILSIGINHGEPKGVHHTHVHVMPRFEGDGGGIMQSLPGRKLQNKDFDSVARKIKSYVRK